MLNSYPVCRHTCVGVELYKAPTQMPLYNYKIDELDELVVYLRHLTMKHFGFVLIDVWCI